MIDENELHPDWKNRLDYVLGRANVQIEDAHKNIEFIVQRATNFIGVYNVLLTVFMLIASPLWLKFLTLLLFVVIFYKLSQVFQTVTLPLQGITADTVETNTLLVTGGKESRLVPTGFFVDKDTRDENYYAWLFTSAKSTEAKLRATIENLAKAYNEALIASKIGWLALLGLWLITSFWEHHVYFYQGLLQAWHYGQSLFL
jgi:hypothetical protein